MSRTLVTIICNRDKWAAELLCRTIKKYLKPCRLIFVMNENDIEAQNLKRWFKDICMPLLEKHQVQLYNKYQFWTTKEENHLSELEYEGWVDQQVLKLAISEKVHTEHYVLFDAKNFFVVPCSIDEINQIIPKKTDWCEPILQNWIVNCLELFGLDIPEKPIRLTQNTTPYVMRTQSARDLLEYFGGSKFLFKWFTIEARKERYSPAEFFLYETYTIRHGYRNMGDKEANCVGFWEHMIAEQNMSHEDCVKYIRSLLRHFDVKVAGIHKGLIKYWDQRDLLFILKRLGVADCLPRHSTSPFLTK